MHLVVQYHPAVNLCMKGFHFFFLFVFHTVKSLALLQTFLIFCLYQDTEPEGNAESERTTATNEHAVVGEDHEPLADISDVGTPSAAA